MFVFTRQSCLAASRWQRPWGSPAASGFLELPPSGRFPLPAAQIFLTDFLTFHRKHLLWGGDEVCVQLLLHLRVGRQQVEAEDARVGGVVHTCLLLLLSTPACKKLKYSCLYLLAKKSNTDCKNLKYCCLYLAQNWTTGIRLWGKNGSKAERKL